MIAERVIELIRTGALAPGDRLPTETQLAQELGVGRTSVREGLGKLRALGLIEVRKGLGAYVIDAEQTPLAEFVRWASTNAVALRELIEARVALEALTAPLAAIRATEDQIATMRACHEAHARAAQAMDVDDLVESDERFHQAIMDAADSQFISRMYEFLIVELHAFRRRTLSLPWAPSRSAHGHGLILESIARHDPLGARRAMLDHLWIVSHEIDDTTPTAQRRPMLPPREMLG